MHYIYTLLLFLLGMEIESFDKAPVSEITNQKTEKSGGIVDGIKSFARNRIFAGALMGTLAATAVTGCDNDSQQVAAPMCETLQDFPVKAMYAESKLNEDGTCTKFGFHYDNKLSKSVDLDFVVTHLKENGDLKKLPFILSAQPGYHYVTIKFEETDGVKDAIVAEILNPNIDEELDCESIAYYNLQPDKRREYIMNPSSSK